MHRAPRSANLLPSGAPRHPPLRSEIRSRFNTMMVVGATVVVAQFGALIAILLRS